MKSKAFFYNVVLRVDSHRGVPESSSVVESKPNATFFVAKTFNNNRRQFNNNNFTRGSASNVNKGPNPNLNCKHYVKVGHTIDRCFEIVGFPQGFKRNPNVGKLTFNANSNVKMNANSASSFSSGFTPEHMQKLLNMINEKPSRSIHANMIGRTSFFNGNVWFNINFSKYFYANSSLSMTNITMRWIIDSGANQHLTVSSVGMFNVMDNSELKITVGHPNDTLSIISHVGNIKLSNNVILYDVLVFPRYCVSLLSVNKLIRDSKMFVGFDENKCYIQDLKRERILGTGSESGHLFPQSPNDDGKDSSVEDGSLPHSDRQDSTQGDIERYKARLMAKGFSQREGFDYDKTFSPVVKMLTVRCLIGIVVVDNWPLYQLDVNNAFLYGDLVEDVYMTLPDGYNNEDKSKVYKLNKSLYCLKQAPRWWNAKLTTALAKHGSLKYFLGIEIVENELGLCMYQRKYYLELLHEYGLLAARPVDIPLLENTILNALKVLRYLKGSPGCEVQFYKNSDLKLTAYADANWAKCPKTRKSVTGFCVFLGKTLISWKSKKQATISKSSSEAEYRSMSSASCEIVWLGNLLHSIGLTNLYPVELCCDNSSAILIVANPVFHERTKHFELDVHLVRQKMLAGIIKIVKVSSKLQTTDVFTKCLGVVQHRLCCKNLGLLNVFVGELVGKDSGGRSFQREK
ncbi:ribonuclease H-like domain-containing protein [Tanacetum coccineum]